MKANKRGNKKKKSIAFDVEAFLHSAGVARNMVEVGSKTVLFSQGDSSKNIIYILKGEVKISVVSNIGKEAIVGILETGDFLGEGGTGRASLANGNRYCRYARDRAGDR
jgi:CRP-like cAMP-binding protein